MSVILNALKSPRWWVVTGLAMCAGGVGLYLLGAAPLAAFAGGAAASFVGSFAHVLHAAAK
jgi:hypothetical protein